MIQHQVKKTGQRRHHKRQVTYMTSIFCDFRHKELSDIFFIDFALYFKNNF